MACDDKTGQQRPHPTSNALREVATPFTPTNCIELLESKLEEARRGEFRALAVVAVRHGENAVNHAWASDRGGCVVSLLGAIHRLANMLQRDLDAASSESGHVP